MPLDAWSLLYLLHVLFLFEHQLKPEPATTQRARMAWQAMQLLQQPIPANIASLGKPSDSKLSLEQAAQSIGETFTESKERELWAGILPLYGKALTATANPTLPMLFTHLQERDYPFVLQTLLNIQDEGQAWRLAYEKVQRLFSLQAKGSGRVALESP